MGYENCMGRRLMWYIFGLVFQRMISVGSATVLDGEPCWLLAVFFQNSNEIYSDESIFILSRSNCDASVP